MARSNIPPKTRWQVLARDGFRCRYCGAKGGDVVLVIDHAFPVVHGGRNYIDNLVTACEECNQGKGASTDRTLPELREYQQAMARAISWLVHIWCDVSGDEVDWMPDEQTMIRLIAASWDFDSADRAITAYAQRAAAEPNAAQAILTDLHDLIEQEMDA